ncbi:hypothetical protein PV326_006178, partial [Microctonus aethiopoides]
NCAQAFEAISADEWQTQFNVMRFGFIFSKQVTNEFVFPIITDALSEANEIILSYGIFCFSKTDWNAMNNTDAEQSARSNSIMSKHCVTILRSGFIPEWKFGSGPDLANPYYGAVLSSPEQSD